MTTVSYRPLQAADRDAVAAILAEAWSDRQATPTVRRLTSAHYLAQLLARSTFTCVAEKDGHIIGIVAARAGEAPAAAREREERTMTALLAELTAEDSAAAAGLRAYAAAEREVDERLLAMSGLDTSHEIILLAVSSAARGLGVGRQLLAIATSYLTDQGAQHAFLFTDTACTWQFYEHLGLTRAAEIDPAADLGLADMDRGYFIYRIDL